MTQPGAAATWPTPLCPKPPRRASATGRHTAAHDLVVAQSSKLHAPACGTRTSKNFPSFASPLQRTAWANAVTFRNCTSKNQHDVRTALPGQYARDGHEAETGLQPRKSYKPEGNPSHSLCTKRRCYLPSSLNQDRVAMEGLTHETGHAIECSQMSEPRYTLIPHLMRNELHTMTTAGEYS